MALSALFRFSDPIDASPAADDPLDVLGGAGPADLEQSLLCLGSRDPRQRLDLGV